jgi:transcriptional regulator with XRE-family HTH domain
MSNRFGNMAEEDPKGLGAYVKLQRGHLRWKRELLASMAGISLSTVERVERGDPVRPAALERIALALGLDSDTFTRPRMQLTEVEQQAWLERSFGWLKTHVPVKVAQLRHERQLRSLSATQFVVFDSDLGSAAADDLAELREWLDFTGFIRGTADGTFSPPPEPGFRMRSLYADVFEHVRNMERRHRAVCLVGTYMADTDLPLLPEAEIGVLALRSKERNPAAAKIDVLFAERRIVREAIAWDS